MSPSIEVVVTVDDAYLDRVAEVAERLRAAGMEVSDTLASIGAITGSVDDSHVQELAGVEGVEHVERARQYRIAPPESDIQ